MVNVNYDYAVDYYELAGVSETLGKAQLRIKVLQAIQKLDVEIRTTIPQRIQREAKGELQKKLGREPTEHEEISYLQEKTQDFDARKRDKEYVEKSRKMQLLTKAKEILVDDASKKRQYDIFHNRQRKATCYDHAAGGEKQFGRNDLGVRKLNSCYFCSQLCLSEYLKNNSGGSAPKKGRNKDNAACHKCSENEATAWKFRTSKNWWYCGGCWNNVPNCLRSGCSKKGWFTSKETGNTRFCTKEHLNEWFQENKNNPKTPPKPKTQQQYLQKLTSLKGWELLTEDEKDRFKNMIRKSSLKEDWEKAITEAKNLIKEKGGDEENPDEEEEEDNDGNYEKFQAEIQKAIREIETELNKEPKIEWKQGSSFMENWKAYLENSSNISELKSRKGELLNIIQTARKQQGGGNKNLLLEIRSRAIYIIKQELENNSISIQELDNPNWESDINEAQSENAIKNIQSQVLADIKNKSAAKRERNRLNELLTQAKQEDNWNNYEKLAVILKQIKELRSSKTYKEKEQQIKEVESRLQELDPTKYQKTSTDLLDQQLKNNGLTDSNMDDETKAALTEAKQNPTSENIAKAEEKIAQNGANNNLNNLINEIESKLEKANLTEKQKVELITKLLQFISKNDYQIVAYKKQKNKVDKLLAELRGEKSQDNTQNPPFWKKALIPLLIISLLGIMITGILIWRRKRLKGKGKWK